ncbi:MAG: rRNA maturation RNase YbeY [Woeseiaceae bacterium]
MTVDALSVDIQFACEDAGVPDEDSIRNWVKLAASRSGRLPDRDVEFAVRVVGEAEIQTLNQLYRNKDTATNVLSFPTGEIEGLPADAARQLGDIVICASVVRDEAVRQSKRLEDHWAHMLVHGALHLLGYDHGEDKEAEEMEHLEKVILDAEGIADPYASRL